MRFSVARMVAADSTEPASHRMMSTRHRGPRHDAEPGDREQRSGQPEVAGTADCPHAFASDVACGEELAIAAH